MYFVSLSTMPARKAEVRKAEVRKAEVRQALDRTHQAELNGPDLIS